MNGARDRWVETPFSTPVFDQLVTGAAPLSSLIDSYVRKPATPDKEGEMQTEPKTLANFNVPDRTLVRFDALCRAIGRSRTRVLIDLMEDFILSNADAIASRNAQLGKTDEILQKSGLLGPISNRGDTQPDVKSSRLQTPSNRRIDPIGFGYSDGLEEWEL